MNTNLTTATARMLGTTLAGQDRDLDNEDPIRTPRLSLTPSAAIDGWIASARDAGDTDLLLVCRSARRRRTVEVAWAREAARVSK